MSSTFFYLRHVASEMTGRFRAERSNYINSKQEEAAFFKRRADGLFSRVADVIRREGR